ncbi:MAG: hypothetical protein ACREA9_15200, partial [Pyrinomonadaceae bacterium]
IPENRERDRPLFFNFPAFTTAFHVFPHSSQERQQESSAAEVILDLTLVLAPKKSKGALLFTPTYGKTSRSIIISPYRSPKLEILYHVEDNPGPSRAPASLAV